MIDPSITERVWRGTVALSQVDALLVGFILFQVWVHQQIRRHLKLDHDLPVMRRYLGAVIETSLPTVILIMQIQSMGAGAALGF
ncbi:hypothetical protein ABTE37_19725, partial [Acinetobacter baumannii]